MALREFGHFTATGAQRIQARRLLGWFPILEMWRGRFISLLYALYAPLNRLGIEILPRHSRLKGKEPATPGFICWHPVMHPVFLSNSAQSIENKRVDFLVNAKKCKRSQKSAQGRENKKVGSRMARRKLMKASVWWIVVKSLGMVAPIPQFFKYNLDYLN